MSTEHILIPRSGTTGGKLYSCLVLEADGEEPFYQVYWARAAHLGAAIQAVLAAAKDNGFETPVCRQADPYDIVDLQTEAVPSPHEDVFWNPTRYGFPPEPLFLVPTGVISTWDEGDHDVEDLVEGFTVDTDEDGLTTIEANVAALRLFDQYSRLVRLFPEYRVFWYVLHGHWDGNEGDDVFLVNEGLNTPDTISEHLEEHMLDSVLNGYVTLTAYLKEGATNLRITDHKRLSVLTCSDTVAGACIGALEDSGYAMIDDLPSIEYGMYHWHYRLPGSQSSREQLAARLREMGFFDWEPGGGE